MTWEEYSKKPGIVPCVRDADGLVVALCVGYSDEELQELFTSQRKNTSMTQ